MSIAVAQPKSIFGLRSGVANNIAYHAEQTIVYPAAAYLVLYNMDNKTQKFIAASEKSEGMTAMAVSPNRRYVAIAEKGEKATIVVYDLHSLRKRKNLTSPDVNCTEFVSIAFSPDSKYLIAQGGGPDWTLLYWTWEKSKVMASIKTTNPQSNAPVYQVFIIVATPTHTLLNEGKCILNSLIIIACRFHSTHKTTRSCASLVRAYSSCSVTAREILSSSDSARWMHTTACVMPGCQTNVSLLAQTMGVYCCLTALGN
jgi:WD40 repeat protein